MTDFHAHLLPGIDDGSDSPVISVRMLDAWREQGIERICATPHFYAEHTTPERFLRRRAAAHDELLRALDGREGYPKLLMGAEVRFFSGISQAEELPQLCLEGTDLLLLEMPFTRWTDRMLDEVADIARRGIVPVAAHIERYMGLVDRKMISRFMDLDILIQCNAEFFLSRRTARKALHMLKKGEIHFLGSDAHNMDTRKPNLGPALAFIERKLGRSAFEHLLPMEELLDIQREEVRT